MNRNSKPSTITKAKKISPKGVDIINILYDDKFITLINNLSGRIKEFYKTNNTHFATMKNNIVHRHSHQNIQNTFSLIEYSFNDFYTQARDIFKKMKSNRNGNLIKLANEQTQLIQPSRCHTLTSTDNTSNVSSKTEILSKDLQLKYDKIKTENNILKKRLEDMESKDKYKRSTSQSRSKINLANELDKAGDMTEFASAVNKFIATVSNVQEKTISNDLMKSDKFLMQTFDKEKYEIGNMCSRYLTMTNIEPKYNASRTLTPNQKKTIRLSSYTEAYNDTSQDYTTLDKKMKIEINNLKKTIESLKQDNEQLKLDCAHLNNLHIIEINKNKSLTEQLLKFESESALFNKERAVLNDKYINLLEENDLLSLSLNNQSNQLQKKLMNNNQTIIDGLKETIAILTKINEEMKTEIKELNSRLLLNNKKDNEDKDTSKNKNRENQLTVLNKKNMDLALKITEIAKEKIKIQQSFLDKDNEVNLLNSDIKYLSDQIVKMKTKIESLNESLSSEQNKTISLLKEHEYINSKLKEFFTELNNQAKDNNNHSNNQKNSKQLLSNSNTKDKDKERDKDKGNNNQLIQEEIQLIKENVFRLIKKHKESLSIDKEKNSQIVQYNKIIDNLNNETKELSNQLNESDSNTSLIIAKHIDEMAKAMNKIDMTTKENNELKSAIKENQNQLKENLQLMNKKTLEADCKIKALIQEVFSQKELIESISKANSTNEKTIEELNTEIQKVKRELDKANNDKSHLDNSIKTLKQEKENNRAEIERYKEANNANIVKINKFDEEKNTLILEYQTQLKQEIQKQNELKQSFEKELSSGREMIQSLIDENVRSIDEYGDKIDNVSKEKVRLNDQIGSLKEIINDKDKEIDKLNSTVTLHKNELELLKHKYSNSNSNANANNNNSLESNEEAKIIEKKYNIFVEEINGKLNALKEKVDQKDKIIQIREDTIILNQEEKEKLLSTIKSKEALINSLQGYLTKNEQSNKSQANKLNANEEMIIDLNHKTQLLNSKLIESNEVMNRKENELVKLTKLIKERDNEVLLLQKEVKEQEENLLMVIDQKIDDNKVKEMQYENDLDLKNKEITSLKNTIEEIKGNVNSLNQNKIADYNEILLLRNQLESKDREIEQRINEIKDKETKIKSKIENISQRDKDIVELSTQLKEKEEQLQLEKTELKNANKTIDTIQNRLTTTEKESQRIINNQLQLQEDAIAELNSLISKQENNIKELHDTIKKKEDEINSNKDSISLLNKTIEDLSDKVKEKEKEINQLNALINELEKDIDHIKEANDSLGSQLKNVTKTLEEKEEELQTIQDELKAKEKEFKVNNDSLNLYKTKQTVLKKNYYEKESDLIKEIELKDNELNIIQSQIDELQKENSELKDTLIQSKKDQETLQQELKKCNEELASLKDKYDDEQIEVKEVILILRKDKESLRSEVSRLKEEIVSYKEKESTMKNRNKEISNYINQIDKLKKDNEDHLNTIKEQNDQLETIIEECDQLKTKKIKDTESIEEMTSDLNQKKKEIDQLNQNLKKSTNEIKELNTKKEVLHKENTDLNNQLKELNKDINELEREIEKEGNKSKKQAKAIELKDNEIEELNKEISKVIKENEDLKQQMRKLTNENKQYRQQLDDYTKEIKDAIALLNSKLSISFKDNGTESSSLIQLIEQIDLTQINTKNEVDEEEKAQEQEQEIYSSDNYTLITIAKINTGLQWYLLRSKSAPKKKMHNDSYQYYTWLDSDEIDSKEFNEPIEKLNDDTPLKNEIKELKTSQEELIDQLNRKETEYKKLNRQITQILGKQKISSEDIYQEKKANQIIDQLKEDNRRLFNELQDMKQGNSKNLGVSVIKEVNNSFFNFDDSNVEELLNEMNPNKPATPHSNNNQSNQTVKGLFDKLIGEIPLTPSTKCTITSILKQCQLSNEDINYLLTKFRTGVISLPNGKLPWKNNN